MSKKGFTIKELLMVIVVIGILCGMAIPSYYHLQTQRLSSEIQKTVTLLQTSLDSIVKQSAAQSFQNKVLPEFLDSEPINQPCLNCFSQILKHGVSDKNWVKSGDREYFYTSRSISKDSAVSPAKGDFRLIYDNNKGQVLFSQF